MRILLIVSILVILTVNLLAQKKQLTVVEDKSIILNLYQANPDSVYKTHLVPGLYGPDYLYFMSVSHYWPTKLTIGTKFNHKSYNVSADLWVINWIKKNAFKRVHLTTEGNIRYIGQLRVPKRKSLGLHIAYGEHQTMIRDSRAVNHFTIGISYLTATYSIHFNDYTVAFREISTINTLHIDRVWYFNHRSPNGTDSAPTDNWRTDGYRIYLESQIRYKSDRFNDYKSKLVFMTQIGLGLKLLEYQIPLIIGGGIGYRFGQ